MENRVREILAAHARMTGDAQVVDGGADLYQLGLTSHAAVNVMLAIEDEFDVEFPDEVLKKATFATVDNIVAVVGSLSHSVA